MTKKISVENVRTAAALQTELCLTQIGELEQALASWQEKMPEDDGFPIEDYQKLDSIKQRLTDVIKTLNCPDLAAQDPVDPVLVDETVLRDAVSLGETFETILDGAVSLQKSKAKFGQLVLF